MLRNGNIAHGLKSEARECRKHVEEMGPTPSYIPWKPYPIQRHGLVCASGARRINSLGRIRIEIDMFDDNHAAETSNRTTDEITQEKDCHDGVKKEDNNEEGVRLVPQQWRLLQDDLNATRSQRKLNARIRARKNELQKADMLLLKRQQLEAAGKVLKERIHVSTHAKRTTSTSEASPFHDIILGRPSSNVQARDQVNQNHESSLKTLHEFNGIFSEDEIALLKRGTSDMNKLGCKKWLPLHVLAAAGEFFLLEEYLKSVVDLDAVDEDGYTPIHRAILGRKETAVSQLLRAGADPHIHDKDGASFLHYSVQTGSLNLVRLFIKYGVDINLADQDGWTAVHVAVLTCQEDILRHLLYSGANKNQETKGGYTPFDLCLALGRGPKTFIIAKNLKQLPKTQSSFDIEADIQQETEEEEQLDAL